MVGVFGFYLTFADSEVALLALSADIGIVLKIYTNAAHFRWMNRFIQMLDDFARQRLLSISILRIVYLHMICMFRLPPEIMILILQPKISD